MARYCQSAERRLREQLDEADSALAFIRELLLHTATEAGDKECRRGCMLMNTASEFAQQDSEIAGQVTLGFAGLRSILQLAIQRCPKMYVKKNRINSSWRGFSFFP